MSKRQIKKPLLLFLCAFTSHQLNYLFFFFSHLVTVSVTISSEARSANHVSKTQTSTGTEAATFPTADDPAFQMQYQVPNTALQSHRGELRAAARPGCLGTGPSGLLAAQLNAS